MSCAVLAGGLLLAACSGNDGDAGIDDDAPGSENAAEGPSPTQPAETEALRSYVEDLLIDYDEAVNQIIADPTVVRDQDDPLVERYLAVFEPGSELAAGALDGWAQQADTGVTIEPVNDDFPAIITRLDGEVEIDDASGDEVRFPFCDEQRYLLIDAEGNVEKLVENLHQHGEGVAVLVDGEWLLRDLQIVADGTGCRTENEGT